MSKGKQWWPLLATSHDVKEALSDFQERLRQKQWLRKDNPTVSYHVYLREGNSVMGLPTVNEYMQFSQQDHSSKNLLRVQVLRALCMLLKWQLLLKSDAVVSDVPQVFAIPSVEQPQHMHVGVMANLQSQNKTFTIIISELPLEQQGKVVFGKTKHWVCPQLGDSYKWLTVKTWLDARKKPSFGKWVFGSYPERRAWIEAITGDASQSLQQQLQENGVFLIESNGESDVKILKSMNATWHGGLKKWGLPEFLDEEATRVYIKQEHAQHEKTQVKSSGGKAGYNQHRKRYDEHSRGLLVEQEQAYVAGHDVEDKTPQNPSPAHDE